MAQKTLQKPPQSKPVQTILPQTTPPQTKLREAFAHFFPQAPAAQTAQAPAEQYCPYRICPLGAHVDHQYGWITGFALDHGVTLRYRPCLQPEVTLHSLNFEGQVSFRIDEPLHRAGDWGDYARAAAASLLEHGHALSCGFQGVIEGTLPIGGLSSSASVIITYLCAFCKVHAIALTQAELIALALWAENHYIGLSVGKLDQSCEVYCKKDHLLFLDTADDQFELIPRHPRMPDFRILIFFSGLTRSLVGSAYNARVDECKAAAYALKGYAGIPYGRLADTRLRDVPREVFERYQDRLPENWRKRATHYYSEVQRAREGAEAWRRGDLAAFGQAIFASCDSSIYNYESGSQELRTLHEIMTETEGIYGGRFSGAGFKGCCMAIVAPEKAEAACNEIQARYGKKFPHLRDACSAHLCASASGVEL